MKIGGNSDWFDTQRIEETFTILSVVNQLFTFS